MRRIARWSVVVVAAAHGLLHLLGAAKGLGWAEVAELDGPISATTGLGWLAAGALVVGAAVLLAVKHPRWWAVAAVAALASQMLVVTSWSDAAAGTVANVVLLVAAGYGWLSDGPSSFRAEYRRRVAAALSVQGVGGTLVEADLAALPEPVAGYVRRSGALGQPRVTSVHARIHGRIRPGPDKPWMRFAAEQVNTYGTRSSRLFLMDATMFGLPVDVLHVFVGAQASMRAKVCSLVPVLDVSGPEMARAETVTLLNDLCIFAPGALAHAPITWAVVDDHHVLASYTNGSHTVTAELVFNEQAELVDFVSDDRLAAKPDGTGFEPQRWSTPLRAYADVGGRHLATAGVARWHPSGQRPFTYVELHLDDVAYNLGQPTRDDGVANPQTSQALEDRGLSCSVGAQHTEQLTGGDGEVPS